MIEKLDKRAATWPLVFRWLYLGLKWFLVINGVYLLIGHYVLTWGWAAAAWFLIAPLAYGAWKAWPTHHQPPGPNPQPR